MDFGDRAQSENGRIFFNLFEDIGMFVEVPQFRFDFSPVLRSIQPDIIDVAFVVGVNIRIPDKTDDAAGFHRSVFREIFVDSDDLLRGFGIQREDQTAPYGIFRSVEGGGDRFGDQYRVRFAKTLRISPDVFEFQYVQRAGLGGIDAERALLRVFSGIFIIDGKLRAAGEQALSFHFGNRTQRFCHRPAYHRVVDIAVERTGFEPENPVFVFVMPVERKVVLHLCRNDRERGESYRQSDDVEYGGDFVLFKWQNQVFQRMHSLFVFRYSVRIDFIGLSVAVL